MDMITIKEGNIDTVLAISQQIPEFVDAYGKAEYNKRLTDCYSSILIAYINDKAVGFKVGYQREDYFYSWMGAVLPEYRQQGVAKLLAQTQEMQIKHAGFERLRFKTRNGLKSMIIFAIKNDFNIIAVEEKDDITTNRIWMEKSL